MRVKEYLGSPSLARPALLLWILICVPLVDELVSGLPVVALPLLRSDLALSYTEVGLLFTVGEVARFVCNPAINLLSDRFPKRWPVLLGMGGLVLGYVLVALAPGYAALLAAFALIDIAGGTALNMAQATLIDGDLAQAARTMTRWTAAGALGDLLAPLAIAAAVAWGLGWRPLFWVGALLWLIMAALVWPQRFPRLAHASAEDDEPHPGVLASLREGLRHSTLLRWIGIVLVTFMLDEIFLGFAALYLVEVLGTDAATGSLILGGQTVGGLLSLLLLDRIVGRVPQRRVLTGAALLTLIGVVALLATRSLPVAAVALFVIGVGAACWYPLAKAAAYATLPGRSGIVRAIDGLGAPFEIALPLLVGAVAQRFGLAAGLGVLGLAPVLVLFLLPRKDR